LIAGTSQFWEFFYFIALLGLALVAKKKLLVGLWFTVAVLQLVTRNCLNIV
jgi:hypothetical protein